MPVPSSYASRQGPRSWLVLGLLLLAQLATLAGGHGHHGLEPALRRSAGKLVFPQACHPQEDSHLEAAGPGHAADPCMLCLHLARSAGAHRPSAPRLAPPVRIRTAGVSAASLPGRETLGSSGSRAPPLA